MNILHISKHPSPYLNDDEGSIDDALTKLGHNVHRVLERDASNYSGLFHDMVLFHHWYGGRSQLAEIKGVKVLWYFDLVDCAAVCAPDDLLSTREVHRVQWVSQISEMCDFVFCSDGDWVNKDESGKTYWLPQGADQRIAGRLPPGPGGANVVFVGGESGCSERGKFVRFMRDKFPDDFKHIRKHFYRHNLGKLISGSEIIVAPWAPVTDNYWSNRVYLTLGFGGFLIHPYCERLTSQYSPGKDLITYTNRDELEALVETYLDVPNYQQQIRESGLQRTLNEHTYLHRCRQMMGIIGA